MARQISRMTITQLRSEIARRHAVLPKLQKKRAELLRAVGALDIQIGALGGQVERPAKRKGRPAKAATRRASYGKSLVQSIKDVLGASRVGMRVKDIVTAVQRAGYKSAAKDFYNMVATAVRGDEFQKLGRGVYKFKAGKAAAKKVKKSKKAPKAGAKKAASPKALRKRKKYAQTAEQFVLGLAQGKGATTAEINRAWKHAGRTGRADNTLNKMLGGGKLKRRKIEGAKGSTYTVA